MDHWPHAPKHRLSESGTYMVTAGTYRKERFFRDRTSLEALHGGLLKYARRYGWSLDAWAVFPNHYHFVAHSPDDVGSSGGESLSLFLNQFHSRSANWLNSRDGTARRKVWHNFWETHLTYHRSYLARLNYVHQNAVRHGLVNVAGEYPWCSASWFEENASRATIETIYGMRIDTLNVLDDYEP